MLLNKKVAFIGAGAMAEAIISGLVTNEIILPKQIHVTNNHEIEQLKNINEKYGVQTFLDLTVVKNMDVIILAVKPKDIQNCIKAVKEYTNNNQLFISVAAGVSTQFLTEQLGHNAPIIRTMPNTSASVGASMTAITAGKSASQENLELTSLLFNAIGEVVTVEEDQIDAITGLSGSGPAYIYYLVEALEKSAKEVGLDEEISKQLVAQVLVGASKKLKQSTETSQELYKQVMSPGGTTEAGLNVLKENQFQETVIACVKAATKRSKELGEQFQL